MKEVRIRKGAKLKYGEIFSYFMDISKSLVSLLIAVASTAASTAALVKIELKGGQGAFVIGIMAGLAITLFIFMLRLIFGWLSHKHTFYERLFSSVILKKRDDAVPTAATTAITALARRKTGQRRAATIALLVSLAVYAVSRLQLELPLSFAVVATLVGACLMLQLADASLDYRIRHGLYGTNEYEARQIISFALNHAEGTDLGGGLGAADIQIDAATEKLIHENWGVVAS